MKIPISTLAAALALASGCAHEAACTYLPTGPATAGGAAASYGVPPAAPQGEVYVTSFGFTDFDVGGGQSARLVHARLAVSNGGPTPLTVDGREQGLEAPGVAREAASFLNTDAGTGPVYVVEAGRTNVFDLYFAVPPALADPRALGGFALDWRVDVAGVAVAERTDFQRFADVGPSYAAYPPYVTVGLGFGGGWWYGPRWGYRRSYPPVIHGYYDPPRRAYGAAWRGPPAGAWRGAPPARGWRGAPPSGASSGAWRGTAPRAGSPSPSPGAWRGAPAPARRSGGGGFRRR